MLFRSEIERLRAGYGKGRTADLARQLGRELRAVYCKAHALGLAHGFIRVFEEREKRAIRLAHGHGVSLTDLSAALGRDAAVVSKHAIRMGLSFATRAVRAPRGPRRSRPVLTLDAILALADGPDAGVEGTGNGSE